MSEYPTLTEMGVAEDSIEEIYKYSLRQEVDQDVLKIYFKRGKSSLLPKSKKFKFGRAAHTHRVDSSQNKYQEFAEMSPFLMKAIDELHKLVQHEHEITDLKARLLNDLEHLEKVMANKIRDLRDDIEKLK
ncbi:MAG: DUF3461 family protein [Motiliproteus sp.]|nr:DUF3461 family protein [Motiliproteus sp.]MCW9051067.1 DUF3461 family protein [Motiliproteus sp.]